MPLLANEFIIFLISNYHPFSFCSAFCHLEVVKSIRFAETRVGGKREVRINSSPVSGLPNMTSALGDGEGGPQKADQRNKIR